MAGVGLGSLALVSPVSGAWGQVLASTQGTSDIDADTVDGKDASELGSVTQAKNSTDTGTVKLVNGNLALRNTNTNTNTNTNLNLQSSTSTTKGSMNPAANSGSRTDTTTLTNATGDYLKAIFTASSINGTASPAKGYLHAPGGQTLTTKQTTNGDWYQTVNTYTNFSGSNISADVHMHQGGNLNGGNHFGVSIKAYTSTTTTTTTKTYTTTYITLT